MSIPNLAGLEASIDRACAEIDQLREQRDRLLAALKLAERFTDAPRERDNRAEWEAMREVVTSTIADLVEVANAR